MLSFSGKSLNEMPLLCDAICESGTGNINFQFLAPHPSMLSLLNQAVTFFLKF